MKKNKTTIEKKSKRNIIKLNKYNFVELWKIIEAKSLEEATKIALK